VSATDIVLVACGVTCLAVSAALLYKMVPREGVPAMKWRGTDMGETSLALGQFILMVAGLAFLVKGVF